LIAELSPSHKNTEHSHNNFKKPHHPNLKSIFTNSDLLLEEAETATEEDEDCESCTEEEDSAGCEAIVRGICEMIEDEEIDKI
jgi:hypothetical protein